MIRFFARRMITMRYISLVVSIMFVLCLIISCGEEEDGKEETPTTGSVSGVVKFVGEAPEGESEVQVSLFSVVDIETGRPAGPPAHFSAPLDKLTGEVPYTISDVSFGEYKLVAVGWERLDSPPGTPEVVIGMYGVAPPDDMQPDSITVSEEQPDVTGIDITADYSQIKE